MKTNKQRFFMVMAMVFSLSFSISHAQGYLTNQSQDRADFKWPEGKKMALSFTFDDARLTQIDKGIPLLDKYNVKATFYLSPDNLRQRLEGWKKAVKKGHDIGNHSLLHPCTINYGWPQEAALENYTLPRMKTELDSASTIIKNLLGVQPVSFAYPCGETFVGKGVDTKSYIPVIASMFESGRLWLSEGPNNPVYCDMANLTGMELDGKSFEQIKALIETARKKGHWLILAGHEINDGGKQTSLLTTIEAVCKYALDTANGIWIDNVHNIASYINKSRGVAQASMLPVNKGPVFPDENATMDLLSHMTGF
jgi:peptidoglycan-N-acetylglucosamine deacetylase